jgi:NADH-quinone oxidoreductase subunit K
MIPLEQVIGLSALLFAIGLVGAVARQNLIAVWMSIEVMLSAVNLAFVGFNRIWVLTEEGAMRLDGQIFGLMVLSVLAAQVVVGLGIVISLARNRDSIGVDDVSTLKW